MNRLLFAVLILGYSNVSLGNFLWIDALRNKTTGQRIVLISDRHSLEDQGAAQAESLVRVIKSLPRRTTGVLLEYPHSSASEARKKFAKSTAEKEKSALYKLFKKLDREGIRYEGLDIRNDFVFSMLNQELHESEKPLHCHDVIEQYQENIDITSQFFHCKKNKDRRSEIEQYACSLLDLTQAQYTHVKSYSRSAKNSLFDRLSLALIFHSGWFYASAVEFDVIALKKIIENQDKKVIFVAAGTAHCKGLMEALQQKMGFALEKLPLQHVTDDPSTFWPDNYHVQMPSIHMQQNTEFARRMNTCIALLDLDPGLRPTEITSYLQSLSLKAPQCIIKRGNPLTYSHFQRWYQDHRKPLTYSAACAAVTTCSTLLFRRRLFGNNIFGKWGSKY